MLFIVLSASNPTLSLLLFAAKTHFLPHNPQQQLSVYNDVVNFVQSLLKPVCRVIRKVIQN